MPNDKLRRDKLKPSDSPYTSPKAESGNERAGEAFSLATFMFLVILSAVGFGITFHAAGLGFAFFIIAGLAFARVKFHDQTAWVRGFSGTALGITLVVLLTPICCSVAFFTNCLAGLFAGDQLQVFQSDSSIDWSMPIAFGLGGITALQVGELIFVLCLRKRDHETS